MQHLLQMLFCSQVTEIGGSFHAGLWSLSALAHCCQTMTLILRTDSKPRLCPVSRGPGAGHGLAYLFCDLLVSPGRSLSGLGGSYTRNNLSHHILFTGFFTWPCSRLSYPLKFMTCSWWEYESTQEIKSTSAQFVPGMPHLLQHPMEPIM